MQKAHSNINWVNYPALDTPINQTNLNLMDQSIDVIDDRVVEFDTTKANQSDLLTAVRRIQYTDSTGIFTITYFNGTTAQIDTGLEKLAVNFVYDDDPNSPTYQKLIITCEDGTKKYVDLSALITQYEFRGSTTIQPSVSSGNVSFEIINGSITGEKLQPNYLADVTTQANHAQEAMVSALQSKSDAEAWAVGERGGEPVDIDDPTFENNAEFYATRSEEILQEVEQKVGLTSFYIDFATGNLMYEGGAYTFYIDTTTGNLMWDVVS